MAALVDGIYDGSTTVAELLEHGDFGVGTFNHLDGEMIVNEGVCFHLFSSGEARVASPDDLSPFAAVTTFEADTTFEVTTPTSKTDLLARIDDCLSSENLFYGIRVTGHFATVTSRTATRQEAPYAAAARSDRHRVRADLHRDRWCPGRLPHARLRAGHLRRRVPLAFLEPRPHRRWTRLRLLVGRRRRRALHRIRTPAQPPDVWTVPDR